MHIYITTIIKQKRHFAELFIFFCITIWDENSSNPLGNSLAYSPLKCMGGADQEYYKLSNINLPETEMEDFGFIRSFHSFQWQFKEENCPLNRFSKFLHWAILKVTKGFCWWDEMCLVREKKHISLKAI